VAKSVRSKTESPRRRTTGARTKPKRDAAGGPQADASKAIATAEPHPESPEPSEEDIRVRAYFRYLERGGSHGASHDDWTEAKKDLESKRRKRGS
jgi:DUF2934 family protein